MPWLLYPMKTVDELPLNARSLTFRWNGLTYLLTIEAGHLKIEYSSATYSKTERIPIESLSTDLKQERWVPDSAWRNGREARYLLLIAVIVYFSKLHEFVPLLAPVALALGLYLAFRSVRTAFPAQKTQICTEDDDHVVSIPHFRSLASQRLSFEQALRRQIEAAKGEADQE